MAIATKSGAMDMWPQAKLFLVEHLGLAKDTLHIYVALIIFFGACLAFGWKARDWRPLALVLLAAIVGEALDFRIQAASDAAPNYAGHFKDFWNTMLAPTAIVLLARFTSVFGRSARDR